MTVKELIKELKKIEDKSLVVKVTDIQGFWSECNNVEIMIDSKRNCFILLSDEGE